MLRRTWILMPGRSSAAVLFALLALGGLAAPAMVQAQRATILAAPAGPQLDSPRLTALWQDLQAGNASALDDFWTEIKGKEPLVETNPAAGSKVRVTFVYKGGVSTTAVFLTAGGGVGGLPPATLNWRGVPSFVDSLKQLALLPGTNLWYRTERIPRDARFASQFGVLTDSPAGTDYLDDPLNPFRLLGSAAGYGSGLELPNAPPVPWIRRDSGVAAGKLVGHQLKSQILHTTRGFTVYTPPGYDPTGSPYGLLVQFDGEVYRDPLGEAEPIILDNLIAKQQIAPLVAVMVETQFVATRSQDLGNSPTFADFLAEELVPWVRQNYHVSADPARTIISGSSLGGLMSSYCGLRHPEVFGNVLSQSGAYWPWQGYPSVNPPAVETETGWLTRQFATTPKLPLRFFMSVGRFEQAITADPPFMIDMPLENERLRDVLEAKGYPVTYEAINGGHDPLNWRSTLPNGLMVLAGPPQASP